MWEPCPSDGPGVTVMRPGGPHVSIWRVRGVLITQTGCDEDEGVLITQTAVD